ncbi:MAG: hypothetical protein Q9224_007338, partial [Gallowayella concinna]
WQLVFQPSNGEKPDEQSIWTRHYRQQLWSLRCATKEKDYFNSSILLNLEAVAAARFFTDHEINERSDTFRKKINWRRRGFHFFDAHGRGESREQPKIQ